jgi:hypothetical protein
MKVIVFVVLLYVIKTQIIKQIKVINQTFFSCDGNKTFSMDKFNDNFCDCDDGSDENSKSFVIL